MDDDPDSDLGVPLQKRQRLAASSDEADFKYVMLADNEGPDSPDSILLLEKDRVDSGVDIQTGAVKPVSFDDAVGYVKKVKVVLHGRREIWKEFIHMLKNYERGVLGLDEVPRRVVELFLSRKSDGIPAKDLYLLVDGFNSFLSTRRTRRIDVTARRLHFPDGAVWEWWRNEDLLEPLLGWRLAVPATDGAQAGGLVSRGP